MSDPNPPQDKLPALRAVDVLPFRRRDGEVYFAVHDPAQITRESLAVSPVGYYLLTHLDGEHSCADIQAAFRAETGQELPKDQILKLVAVLDETLLLDNDRFAAAYDELRAAYRAAPARDCRERYPDAHALRAQIDDILAAGAAAAVGAVRGLIAPHLDYARGRPCYADAYATLRKAPLAERFVILGTNHAGRSRSVVATTKDFATPLGRVPTDREFIRRLEEQLGASICEHELDHLNEHSIELQVIILQAILADRPFEIVPVLCPDVCGSTKTAPADGCGPDLRDFARVLQGMVSESDRPTTIIAAADLSHFGQRFGDPDPTTADRLEEVARSDRDLLALLESHDEEAFLTRLTASGNQTRICSVGCIYALMQAIPDRPCRVLNYHQAVDREAETNVTCAAVVVT